MTSILTSKKIIFRAIVSDVLNATFA